MTIRYVQTNDNKYLQFRCMAQNFTTDVTKWQGVDGKPTANSKILVESGGTFDIIQSYVNLFVGAKSINKSGKVSGNVNYSGTTYIKLYDGESYPAKLFYGSSSVSACYVYDANKQPLGEYLPEGYIVGTFTTILSVASIKSQYPTAAYIRLSGEAKAIGDRKCPYFIYPHIREIYERCDASENRYDALENKTDEIHNVYVNYTTGLSLETAVAAVPNKIRSYVKIIAFRNADDLNRFYFYEFIGTSDNFTDLTKWLEIGNARDCVYNLMKWDDTSTTYTLSTAIAAVPEKYRRIAKVICYRTTSGAELAIFKSFYYVSGWNNTENWTVLADKGFVENFIDSSIKAFKNYTIGDILSEESLESTLYKEGFLLTRNEGTIFNYRTAQPLMLDRNSNQILIESTTPPFCFFFLVTNEIIKTNSYTWKHFGDEEWPSWLYAINFVTTKEPASVGKDAIHTGSYSVENYRGYITSPTFGDDDNYLYLTFKLHSTITDVYDAIRRVARILATITIKNYVGTGIVYPSEYIDYYKPNANTEELVAIDQGIANSGKLLEVGPDGIVSPQIVNISTLGGLPNNLGSDNANKILQVDESGQIVAGSVIPQGSTVGIAKYNETNTLYLGADVLPGSNVVLGAGWSGNLSDGFGHTSGNTAPVEIQYNTTANKKYIVNVILGAAQESSIFVQIGNSEPVDVYNGGTDINVGLIADGGTLKIIPVSSFSSTVKVSLKEVVSQENADSILVLYSKNVNHGQMISNITGFWNLALGAQNTLSSVQNGSRNIALGFAALANFISGTRNIGIGTFAMSQLVAGDHNIAIGSDSLWYINKASDNVAIGFGAFWQMPAGAEFDAQRNVVIGAKTMTGAQVSSYDNVAIGHQAGTRVGTQNPNKNVSIGSDAGRISKEGNVAIGHNAGYYTSGNNNVAIGRDAGAYDATAQSNSIAIGYNVKTTKSNQCVIGNSDVTEFVLGTKKLVFNNDNSVTWETIS